MPSFMIRVAVQEAMLAVSAASAHVAPSPLGRAPSRPAPARCAGVGSSGGASRLLGPRLRGPAGGRIFRAVAIKTPGRFVAFGGGERRARAGAGDAHAASGEF
jgi:hypothetical protein